MLDLIVRPLLFLLVVAAVTALQLGYGYPVSRDERFIRERFEKPGRRVLAVRRTGIDWVFRRYPVRQYEVRLQSENAPGEVRRVGIQDSALGLVWWRHDHERDRWRPV